MLPCVRSGSADLTLCDCILAFGKEIFQIGGEHATFTTELIAREHSMTTRPIGAVGDVGLEITFSGGGSVTVSDSFV